MPALKPTNARAVTVSVDPPTRILAAEDDAIARKILDANLRKWNYEPLIASNGTEAWEILARPDAPRLVILDWMMPGMDGLEICRKLREREDRQYTHILLLTGRNDQGDLIAAFEAGADDYLTKPFHARELQLRLAAGARRIAAVLAPPRVTVPAPRAPSTHPLSAHPLSARDDVWDEPGSPCAVALVGATIGGKYLLIEPIAAGGMGTVWRGLHRALGTRVAIKFIRPEYASNSTSVERFANEARASARLQSQYVVRVYDYGVTDDGLPYLVMEYLDGCSLADAIEQRGALPVAETLAIIGRAAHALSLVHAVGIIHRDIKPDNIMLVRDADVRDGPLPYSVKLVDFGLARMLDTRPTIEESEIEGYTAPPGRPLTQDGALCGTPNYMSPETLLGDGPVDLSVDLWALGASTFQALTGRLAFEGDVLGEVIDAVCMKMPPVPSRYNPALPAAVDAWFARACHPDPGQRFHDTVEFVATLEAACVQATSSTTPVLPTRTQDVSGPATAKTVPEIHRDRLVATAPEITLDPRPVTIVGFGTPRPARAPYVSPRAVAVSVCVVLGLAALVDLVR